MVELNSVVVKENWIAHDGKKFWCGILFTYDAPQNWLLGGSADLMSTPPSTERFPPPQPPYRLSIGLCRVG